ncbi:cobalamin-5'-phosphate synthase [Sinobacterium caligoides]|uniref:Adenosylcobinamide-GDP ribazoletransferase n=1 Tax=Sinobacterium caligoides TaxID=933926 RepID=A0A3N2DQ14_9GAMM|nr:adenosylcobinamide-GDP ribazoletransferase [Sinobacterium caligoides]ROS01870.1 cobalamin-5'-phosphate synthase [Sinobacterium caligoides]
MLKQLKLFCLALAFLSRIPVPQNIPFSEHWQRQAQRYYPAVGLLLALLLLPLFYSVSYLLGSAVGVVAMLAASTLLTGGLHEDGFADCCDGFGGGYGDREKTLLIMKDSLLGTFGVIGLVLLLLLKYALLQQLALQSWTLFGLTVISAYSMSRWQPLLIMRRLDYVVRDSSRVVDQAKRPSLRLVLLTSLWGGGGLLLLALLHSTGVQLLAVLLLPAVLLSLWSIVYCHYLERSLAGYTGDCLGATQQVAECIIYCSMVFFLRQGWLF